MEDENSILHLSIKSNISFISLCIFLTQYLSITLCISFYFFLAVLGLIDIYYFSYCFVILFQCIYCDFFLGHKLPLVEASFLICTANPNIRVGWYHWRLSSPYIVPLRLLADLRFLLLTKMDSVKQPKGFYLAPFLSITLTGSLQVLCWMITVHDCGIVNFLWEYWLSHSCLLSLASITVHYGSALSTSLPLASAFLPFMNNYPWQCGTTTITKVIFRFFISFFNFSIDTFTHRYNSTAHGRVEMDETILVRQEDGHWSAPYFDCGGGNIWMMTYTVPFFGRHDNGTFYFK